MSKGSSFERQFCDQLSEWWTGEKGRRVFWRSSNSGGMATVRNKKGKKTKQHCGDVCAIDPVGFPLTDFITIELKRGYSRHTIADLLDKPKHAAKQVYEKWIEQAEKAAEGAGTPYWLLVVKRDHREPLVFLKGDFHHELFNLERGISPPAIVIHRSRKGLVVQSSIWGMPLNDFFARVSPDDLRELWVPGESNIA